MKQPVREAVMMFSRFFSEFIGFVAWGTLVKAPRLVRGPARHRLMMLLAGHSCCRWKSCVMATMRLPLITAL